MKAYLALVYLGLTFVLTTGVQAKNRDTQAKLPLKATEKATNPISNPPLPAEAIPETLKERFEIFAAFSQGLKLEGFTDPRYVADDKTDYLKSTTQTANLEFSYKVPYSVKGSPTDSTLQELFHGTEFLRFGGQLTGWNIRNAQSVAIPKTGAPINGDAVAASIAAATRPGIGFFFGLGKKDFEVDIGLTMFLAFENEGSRTRRVIDANGNATGATEQVEGRGLFISNAFVFPNFKLQWGGAQNLQFFVTAGREIFDYHRDYLQSYFRLPLSSIFKLDIGVGLFPAATIFIQPNFVLGPVMIGLRGGMTLNYYSSELKKVSLTDAAYFGLSVSGRF